MEPMTGTGLREVKKARTRQFIAETAARLFAERGYENVAVIDVARAAGVAEKTVYNYFPAKEHLLLDQDDDLRDRLVSAIRSRAGGVSPAAAITGVALGLVEGVASMPAEQVRGGLGYLAAVSPAVRRLCLEMTDRHADAIAAALTETTEITDPALAKVRAVALAWVIQTITDETGRRARQGQTPAQITDGLRPVIAAILDDLDRWPAAATARPATRQPG
jgi:AcrR family transcriptional regulator